MNTPTAFISYSWDSKEHKAWVKDLATKLRAHGVDVILDVWAVYPNIQLPAFMEQAISDSDFVLVICTPGYKERSDERRGGVGYEGHIITSEIFNRGNHEKFIPIRRCGTWGDGERTDAAATWIRGGYYIDLFGDPYSADKYTELVLTLFGQRETAPPLGEPMSTLEPASSATGSIPHPRLSEPYFARQLKGAIAAAGNRYTPELHVDLDITQQLETFSRTKDAIDRIKSHAIEIRKRLRLLCQSGSGTGYELRKPDLGSLTDATNDVLQRLAALEAAPTGEIPLVAIVEKVKAAEQNANEALNTIANLEREYLADQGRGEDGRQRGNSPYARQEGDVYRLQNSLRSARVLIDDADKFANSRLLILKGEAGTGKTHLLCDFASSRVAAGAPVILLSGHRFTETAEPWTQVRRLTEMHDQSVEQFIDALEEAARAADARALLIIDAVNEGQGIAIWPEHLPAFLARLEESPWIGAVLSVRSSYAEVAIPDDVRDKATWITHRGFEGREYEAARMFFTNYGLEFPSAPVLHPGFRNPLFLKTICEGLSGNGETRLSGGFRGITWVFNLYLNAVNKGLAKSLDYNPKDNLARAAVNRIASEFAEAGRMSLPRQQVSSLVDELLPGRGFSKSLYHGLVTAGVLTEDVSWGTNDTWEEVAFITYERLADHIIADWLLKQHLDASNPEKAFTEGGGLAFLSEGQRYVSPGLMEALCIQVPEQTGRELIRLAPRLVNFPGIGRSFQESLVWRELGAFSEDTLVVWNELIDDDKIWDDDDPTDTLLTVSTVPDHRFNAEYLDRRLRQDAMPDRDAWWNIYLHKTWESEGPVDRLVDWASSISPEDVTDTEVVDLAATSLAWMLATSNRFLRDRATKALVALLTGRLESTTRLVERFADVDDPYVEERVYAVAYGVTMRSHNPAEVGRLASLVYEAVFAGGCPPAHVLLRDHARGVIERAIQLGADIAVDLSLVRPRYRSVWPRIPDEAEVEDLIAEHRSQGEGTDSAFSVDRIQRSVTDDDFAIYVIGRRGSFPWLSLPLTDDPWQSPEERIQSLLPRLSETERLAWEEYDSARIRLPFVINFGGADGHVGHSIVLGAVQQPSPDDDPAGSEHTTAVNQGPHDIDSLRDRLMAVLAEEHRVEIIDILAARDTLEGRTGPRFDPQLVQRYIIWRVFDLGWTVAQFGEFDRYVNRRAGREAAKAERIGKKYQWIAYHEMVAYLADHYQYHPLYSVGENGRRFQGPWQEYLRDIDPSWVPSATMDDGTGNNGTGDDWWMGPGYAVWADDLSHADWLACTEDLPRFEEFLKVCDPNCGVQWLVVYGDVSWEQPHPADMDRYDVERRRFGFTVAGYFVHAGDSRSFAEWLDSTEGIRHGTESRSLTGDAFFGEYGWGPAFEYHLEQMAEETMSPGEPKWSRYTPKAAVSYDSRSSAFDCSESEGSSTLLPHHELIARLGLQWSGKGAEFLDEFGQLAAFATSGRGNDHTALLIREDLVKRYMAQEDLVLCWTVAGTKMTLGGESTMTYRGRLAITGFYEYDGDELHGSVTSEVDLPADADNEVL